MERILDLDRQFTLAINGWHSPFFDAVMVFASKVWVWVPLYLFVIFWFFWKKGWKQGLVIVCALFLGLLLSDRISFHLKESIGRLRPFADPLISDSVRLLEKAGNHLCGFPSGHACNAFCAAFISSMVAGRRWWAPVAFSWATLLAYSRVYLGKHFLGDIIAGALLGLALGAMIYLCIRPLLRLTTK